MISFALRVVVHVRLKVQPGASQKISPAVGVNLTTVPAWKDATQDPVPPSSKQSIPAGLEDAPSPPAVPSRVTVTVHEPGPGQVPLNPVNVSVTALVAAAESTPSSPRGPVARSSTLPQADTISAAHANIALRIIVLLARVLFISVLEIARRCHQARTTARNLGVSRAGSAVLYSGDDQGAPQ